MKKYIFLLLFLMVSLSLAPFSYSIKAVEETPITIETYYPEDILDYADLTNIQCFSINNNYIAYTLDGNSLNIFDKNTKQTNTINNFTNIKVIKYSKDKILVVDEDKIYIIEDYTLNTASAHKTLIDNLPNYSTIDIYTTNYKTYIGYVYGNTFKLLEYTEIKENALADTTKTFTSDYYNNAYMLAINENKAYIVYYIVAPSQNGICIQDYRNDTPIVNNNFVVYAQLLDTFYCNQKEYLVTFTNELLILLDHNFTLLDDIRIGMDINIENNSFPILNLSHFEFYNNTLFVSDKHYKTIQSFTIEKEENSSTLKSDNILLCGHNQAKGRFNNVNNIFIQGNTIYTADTNNNRIQILTHSKSSIINMPSNYISPISVCRDSNNSLYVITINDGEYKILKYQYVNNNYTLAKTITPAKSNCQLSSLTIINDKVYVLDYYNNEIITVNNDTTSFLCKFLDTTNSISDIKENSKIDYIKKNNQLVILNDNEISLHNINGEMLSKIQINNCKDITTGLNEIYAINNNIVSLININENTLETSTKQISDDRFTNYSNFTYDIINDKFYAFNSAKSCLVYFSGNLVQSPFTFDSFNNGECTTINNIPYIYELTYDPLIYTHPYNLGDYFNNDYSIENVIAVEEFGDYIRIIFNNNNTLAEGFVNKYKCTKLDYNYSVTNVIATNQIVPIYKYPTLLQLNDNPITCGNIPMNTKITLTHTCPVSIDGKTFFMFQSNGNIGFLYSQDIILDTSKNITNLNIDNASIKLIDISGIYLYAEDKSTIIRTLKDDDRIYVEEYDKHSEYTKVIYKDSNHQTYEGYIKTEYIEMDALDLSKIVLISIIVVSILILVIILAVYLKLKKKK